MSNAIIENQQGIDAVYQKYIEAPKAAKAPQASGVGILKPASLDDDALIEKARQAHNGDLFSRLYFDGDTSGYKSQSEADLALCNILAFWTGKNQAQMDRLFRLSALYREKWDIVHVRGQTYGEATIDKAIAKTLETYRGDYAAYSSCDNSSPVYNALSYADILNRPPPTWRISGVFTESGVAAIYGPSGSGKSFLALDLASALALGENWLHWPTKPCEVLYIYLESEWGLRKRLEAREKHTGSKPLQGLSFITEHFDLRNSKHVEAIIKAAPQKGLVIIDTLNRATPGLDENSGKEMSTVIQSLSKIQQATEGLVILVAHTGKNEKQGIRGHSSLFAAIDTAISVTRNGNERAIKITKIKEGEDGQGCVFDLKIMDIGFDADNRAITSCVVEPISRLKNERKITSVQQLAFDALNAACESEGVEYVNLENWRNEFYAKRKEYKNDTNKRVFNDAKKELIKKDFISVKEDKYSTKKYRESMFENDSDSDFA